MHKRMTQDSEKLQQLHEALKASKAAAYFVKLHWPEYSYRLSLESPKATEHNNLVIHITVDKHHPEAFTYEALSNKPFNNPEKYLTIETKEGVSTSEMIEVVYRLLVDWGTPSWTKA